MFTLERTSYGLKTVMTGTVTLTEVRAVVADLKRQLASLSPGFSTLSDQSQAKVISDPAIERELSKIVPAVLAAGVGRICVLAANSVTAMQSQRMAREAGLGEIYHCVNGKDQNAEKIAEAWVTDGRRLVGV